MDTLRHADLLWRQTTPAWSHCFETAHPCVSVVFSLFRWWPWFLEYNKHLKRPIRTKWKTEKVEDSPLYPEPVSAKAGHCSKRKPIEAQVYLFFPFLPWFVEISALPHHLDAPQVELVWLECCTGSQTSPNTCPLAPVPPSTKFSSYLL